MSAEFIIGRPGLGVQVRIPVARTLLGYDVILEQVNGRRIKHAIVGDDGSAARLARCWLEDAYLGAAL